MKRVIAFLCLLVSSPAYSAQTANPNVMNVESVTILASSSMTVPITEISKQYSRKYNTDVNAVYDASGELLLDIEDGDPADIIITPSKMHLDKMKEEGLIDANSIVSIAKNRLSIITSKNLDVIRAERFEDTLTNIHNKTLMIIGDPSMTSLGSNTVAMLKKAKLWPIFEKRVVLAPTSTKTVDYIIKGESAGIVLQSDTILYRDDIVNLGTIPDEFAPPLEYYAAVVVSGNMVKARNYLKYLSSKEAKSVLKDQGFVVE